MQQVYGINFWENVHVTTEPFTFATPRSSVMIFDIRYSPALVPIPPRYAAISTVKVIILQNTPSKPVQVEIDVKVMMENALDPMEWVGPRMLECGWRNMFRQSSPTMFYYDSLLAKWVSLTSGHSYNASSGMVQSKIDPSIFVRNGMTLFVAVLSGVPRNASSTVQYTIQSVGVKTQEEYRAYLYSLQNSVENECIRAIPVDSEEVKRLSEQGFTAMGTPQLIGLDIIPNFTIQISLPVPPLESVYFQGSPVTNSSRRRLLQLQTGGVLSEASIMSSIVPYFFNTSIGAWQPLSSCRYNATDRVYVCPLSVEFFRLNGVNVMAVNTLPGNASYNVDAGFIPATTTASILATTTPSPQVQESNQDAIIIGLAWAAGAIVAIFLATITLFSSRRRMSRIFRSRQSRKPHLEMHSLFRGGATTIKINSNDACIRVPLLHADVNEFLQLSE